MVIQNAPHYDKNPHPIFHPTKVLTNTLYLVKVEIVILLLYQFSELKQRKKQISNRHIDHIRRK